MRRVIQVNREIKRTLLGTGLPWRTVPGHGHQKIELAGKLVAVVPSTGKQDANRRAVLNVRAQIRRAAKEMKNG